MNQTFDLHRFGLMLKLDLAEKGKNNLGMAALLVVVLLFFMLPVTTSNSLQRLLGSTSSHCTFYDITFGKQSLHKQRF